MSKAKQPRRCIVQIIPAGGWWAKFKSEEGKLDLYPLICFALVQIKEPDGTLTEEVHGMDADSTGYTEFADAAENFAGLIHDSDPMFDAYRRGDLPAI